jgi:hypothetical protein
MRRFAPANVEQFLQEHGVVLGRPQQQLAVARMYGGLLAREKSGPDPCARGPECEHGGEPATVSNAASRNHGSRADHVDHCGNKGQSSNGAPDMFACFPTLRYNYVHPALDGLACHFGRADSVHHDSARFLGTAHQSTRLTPKEGDNRNLFREAHIQPFVLGKLQIQINAKRFRRQRPGLPDLLAHGLCNGTPERQHT